MVRLTKEERAVFDPTALLEKQKWQTDLLIGKKEPGKEEGGHSPYQPWKPAPGGPYVPAPGKGKELAGWSLPGGTGNPLTEDLYWDGLKTILETTEPNSDEQNMRLNILWHQFHDQVQGPSSGMKIARGEGGKDQDTWKHGLSSERKFHIQKLMEQWRKDSEIKGKPSQQDNDLGLTIRNQQLASAKTPSQQAKSDVVDLIRKLTNEGKHNEAQALYREQFGRV